MQVCVVVSCRSVEQQVWRTAQDVLELCVLWILEREDVEVQTVMEQFLWVRRLQRWQTERMSNSSHSRPDCRSPTTRQVHTYQHKYFVTDRTLSTWSSGFFFILSSLALLITSTRLGWLTLYKFSCFFCQINDAQQAAQDTKDQAKELQDRINDNMDSYEREKKKTKELIQRVKDYLMGECSAAASPRGSAFWSVHMERFSWCCITELPVRNQRQRREGTANCKADRKLANTKTILSADLMTLTILMSQHKYWYYTSISETLLILFRPWQMRWFLQKTLKKWPELFWTSSCHDHLIRFDQWSITSTICCPTPPTSRTTWVT